MPRKRTQSAIDKAWRDVDEMVARWDAQGYPDEDLSYPPTLSNQERIMNDLKPAAQYLSPGAIVIALGLTLYMIATQTFTLPLGLLALILALTALWLQNESK